VGEGEVERACDRSMAEHVPLSTIIRTDPELGPHLNEAEVDRLTDPALYLGSAGPFVDRLVARVAALN
jgi:3-carboxy-cis,cis-muconate cycloisomerase